MGPPGVKARPVIFACRKCAAQGLQYSNDSGDTADHAADVTADRTGRRHHGAARRTARRARSRWPSSPGGSGVNKSTGHAILTSLAAAGWVLRDPTRKTYRLGPAMVALGRQAVGVLPRARLRPAGARRRSVGSSPPPAPRSAWATTRSPCSTRSPIRAPRADAFRVGRLVPVAPAARRGGGGVGVRRGARRLARPRARPTPAPTTPTRSPPPTTAASRSRSRPRRSRASASSRACSATTRRPAPRSTASPTSSPPTRSSSPSTLDPDRDYAVNVVNAPVFDHTGQVTLVLSLTGFGRALRGTEVVAAGDALARRHPRHHRRPLPHSRPNISKLTVTDAREPRDVRYGMEGVAVSRPLRSRVPVRASVSAPSRTMGVPFTRTCSMPSASA